MALKIALDANRYTDFFRGDPYSVDVVERADTVTLSFITVAELRAGFRAGTRTQENEQRLARFLQKPRVNVLYADDVTTQIYAEIYADLRAAGTPIPTNDIWIAAIVLQHGLVLFSRDTHFERIPRLPRI